MGKQCDALGDDVQQVDLVARAVGPGRQRRAPPRHPTHYQPSLRELNGIIRRGVRSGRTRGVQSGRTCRAAEVGQRPVHHEPAPPRGPGVEWAGCRGQVGGMSGSSGYLTEEVRVKLTGCYRLIQLVGERSVVTLKDGMVGCRVHDEGGGGSLLRYTGCPTTGFHY